MLKIFNDFFIKIKEIVLPEKSICNFLKDSLNENSMNEIINNIISEIKKLKKQINKINEKKKYTEASTNTEFDYTGISDIKQTIENNHKYIIKKVDKLYSMIEQEDISIKDNKIKTINNNENISPVKEKKNKAENTKKNFNKTRYSFKMPNNYNNKKINNNNINIIKSDIYYKGYLSKINSSSKKKKILIYIIIKIKTFQI